MGRALDAEIALADTTALFKLSLSTRPRLPLRSVNIWTRVSPCEYESAITHKAWYKGRAFLWKDEDSSTIQGPTRAERDQCDDLSDQNTFLRVKPTERDDCTKMKSFPCKLMLKKRWLAHVQPSDSSIAL